MAQIFCIHPFLAASATPVSAATDKVLGVGYYDRQQ
jgi:hypothetical protein